MRCEEGKSRKPAKEGAPPPQSPTCPHHSHDAYRSGHPRTPCGFHATIKSRQLSFLPRFIILLREVYSSTTERETHLQQSIVTTVSLSRRNAACKSCPQLSTPSHCCCAMRAHKYVMVPDRVDRRASSGSNLLYRALTAIGTCPCAPSHCSHITACQTIFSSLGLYLTPFFIEWSI